MIQSLPETSNKPRTIFVLSIMTFGILLLIIDSMQEKGWISAAWWGYGLSAVFFAYALITRDSMLLRFILFSVTAGFAELVSDAWLVEYTKTLIYPHDEPMLLSSPAYMPFSWTVVLMEVGYIGWLVSRPWGILKSSIFLCFLGAMLVPLYESWAIHAGWWYYQNTPLVLKVPIYVIIAEGLLMITLPFMLRKIENAKPVTVILWGLAEGVVMLIACLIAYAAVGLVKG
jgi:hypothetical protein